MTMEAFDLCGPLPTGVTVLEASAGTGKTFTIAALAARYVAAGTPLPRLLLVTFTRMATGELRDRVRERLVSAEHGLARALGGAPVPADDEVLVLLAKGSREEVERRRQRLADALSDFDAATIATIHQFCDSMLAGLGTVGDVEPDVTFLDDARELVDQVIDDLYVRRFHRAPGVPLLTRAEAREVGHLAVDNPDAAIWPDGDDDAAMRVRLARAVCQEVEVRKRRAGLLTYDDLLTRLRDTLADPERGLQACGRLRARYAVALVDEFQDTDPIQWEILERIFGRGGATLVLIGDPKQAIYAFRGADVHAYLRASRAAGTRATLATNWRSDQGLIDAFDALFGEGQLGHPEIRYRHVEACEDHRSPRLLDAPVAAPLRLRTVPRDRLAYRTQAGAAPVEPARSLIAGDLAADLVRLLSSTAQIEDRGPDGRRERVAVQPGHVAVLVRTNRQAELIRDALATAGVPAVTGGSGSVLDSDAAHEWLRLLQALERPSSPTRAHTAALTPFVGWPAAQVAAADERAWEELHAKLHRWADVLSRRGVASLQEALTVGERLPERVLAVEGGERTLTDLRHVAELLHAAATGERLGPAALAAWLRQRIRDAADEAEAQERSRRLESDAAAVQVLTIHRCKGLEFPIVYAPFLWDPSWIPDDSFPRFHDPDNDERRTIDLSGTNAPTRRRYIAEERGEDLRLLYVALTRAQHQAVLWWAGSAGSKDSSLSRLTVDREADGTVPAWGSATPSDAAMTALLCDLAARAPGRISVEVADLAGDAGAYAPDAPALTDLEVEHFDRQLDRRWRRTSYSAITAGQHEGPRVGSEPDTPVIDDEDLPEGVAVQADPDRRHGDEALRAVALPLAEMPGGAEVGTFVHRVLETVDFTVADLTGALADAVADAQRWRTLDVGSPAALVAGLEAAIATPLGPLVGDLALRDIGRGDRVDELTFELPLVGGDEARAGAAALDVGGIAAALRRHLGGDDPLSGYAARLDDPTLRSELRGYLTGSLDLVLRLGSGSGARYVVADYKSNWLGVDGEPLTAWHYRPAALREAMFRGHYGLQALLYSVALHRYLRWRLPGYDPARNLAGVLYLFVRGMAGADTPVVDGERCGVFSWPAVPALIEDLSDLFDRGAEVAA